MNWEEVYNLWKQGSRLYGDALALCFDVEEVHIPYDESGYIFGYDWLSNDFAERRKKCIADDPAYFHQPYRNNMGTIHTAQMLAEAADDEE